MTNEFVEMVGTVASVLVGNTGNKSKKAPAFDPNSPAFTVEAVVVSEENKTNNEKVENNMTKENVVVEAVVVEEAVVTEEKKGFFTKFKSVVTELTGKAKAKLEDVKSGTATEGATKEDVSKEDFLAKAKAFGKGFVEGAVGFVKEHAVKAFAGLAALTIAGTFTTGMTAAVLVALPLYAVGSFAVSYLVSKYKKEEFAVAESAVNAALESVVYGFFGAIAAFYVAQLAVIATASVFVYGYVAVSYIGYFIVA